MISSENIYTSGGSGLPSAGLREHRIKPYPKEAIALAPDVPKSNPRYAILVSIQVFKDFSG